MPPLPSPVRAALGLAVTVLDEARRLPDRAIDVPMRAVSLALQLSLRAQQRYAAFAARGDEVLSGRQTGDEAPPWATFDAPVDVAPAIGAEPAGEAADARAETAADDTPAEPRPRPRAPKRTTKTVRAPRTGRPSAFDAVADPEDTVVSFDAAAAETADAGATADDDPDTRPGSSDDAD
jgi:hypothetical protein